MSREVDTPLEQAPFVVMEATTHDDVTIINIWRKYHEDKKWHCFVNTFNPKDILDMLEHKFEEGLFFEVVEFFESGARAASSPDTLLARLNMVSGDQHG